MIITLSPEIEEAVIEQAREQGKTPEQLALESCRQASVAPKIASNEILKLAAQDFC